MSEKLTVIPWNRIAEDVPMRPCPFCGREAKTVGPLRGLDYYYGWALVCMYGCGAQTNRYPTPDEAVAAWNRRATEDGRE